MQFLIEWSISRGLKKFDLTIGDEDYKRLWADHSLPLYDCIRGLTRKGKIYRDVLLAGKRAKEWAKRRPWLVALVRALRRRRTFGRRLRTMRSLSDRNS
jgi:CelD/BcsL family acetyltransferase involved in cellulose biosynthesis